MPHVNRQFSTICQGEWSMKVAFASSDYHHVDQHFGATPKLVIYGVKQHEVTLLRVVDFSVLAGHQQEKLDCRIHALEDCVTLYCVAIGEAVFRQLLQIGVRAVRVPQETTIAGLLQEIQHYWYDKEQRKTARNPQRFARMLQEQTWQEEDEG
ncbi:NifB/NifX family molybdenum-iron cluster-binding protein [Kosakonia pseudosacchari]|uniref:NifB/NifX family molybdenum-iron cluster-binding protein n=1 Tax=Kosakonia pseudosacchari TaxID=1646340 RepID=UPI00187E327C|nr:NifB/NifX family molybdenum-iron cluster-binding protein [Kosakonia pseudosacchari]QOV66109.1 nitrogen fixation protein NifX [Kosakonia pseudosacchari]